MYSIFVKEIGSICLLIIVDECINLKTSLDIRFILIFIIFVNSVVLLLETLRILNGFLGKVIIVSQLNLTLDALSSFLLEFISELSLLGFNCLFLLIEFGHFVVDFALFVILRLFLKFSFKISLFVFFDMFNAVVQVFDGIFFADLFFVGFLFFFIFKFFLQLFLQFMDFVQVTLIMFVLLAEFLLELLDHVMTGFDGVLTFFVKLFQFLLVFSVKVSLFLLGESMYWSSTCCESVEWVLFVFICLFRSFHDSVGINSLSFCLLRILFALVVMMMLFLDERSGLLLILLGGRDFSFLDSFLKFGQGVNEIVGILDSMRSLSEIQSALHIFNSGLNFHDRLCLIIQIFEFLQLLNGVHIVGISDLGHNCLSHCLFNRPDILGLLYSVLLSNI